MFPQSFSNSKYEINVDLNAGYGLYFHSYEVSNTWVKLSLIVTKSVSIEHLGLFSITF